DNGRNRGQFPVRVLDCGDASGPGRVADRVRRSGAGSTAGGRRRRFPIRGAELARLSVAFWWLVDCRGYRRYMAEMRLKLQAFRHSVKGGVALKGSHVAQKQPETDRAAPVTVVDAVDKWREFLAPVVIGGERLAGTRSSSTTPIDSGL